ncbi:MAG: histidine kinase [Firmicutes bacterium]|nr:histidine kinase [Bacillota bacterium]
MKGKDLFQKLSLKNKMMVLIVVQIITIICIYGYSSYHISNKIISDKTKENITITLNAVKHTVDDYVRTMFDISQDLLYDERIYFVGDSEGEQDEFKMSVENLLKQSAINADDIYGIWLLNSETEAKYVKAKYKLGIGSAVPQIREMFNQSDEKDVWYITGSDYNPSGIYYCRNIYDPYTFKKIGNLIFQVEKEYFGEVCRKYSENLMNIMLVSKSNHFIYSGGDDDERVYSAISGYMTRKKQITLNDKRNQVMVSSVVCDSNGWRIISYSRFKDIYGDLYIFLISIVFLCVFSILIIFVCNKYLRDELINPINMLVGKMMDADCCDGIADEISNINQKEFKIVFDSFNSMNKRIRTLIDQNYRARITSTTAQIKALQAQINPHFIFNTLQCIQWMAYINNVPEIGNVTDAMAKIMDASIARDDKLIPLHEEIEYVDSYMHITKVRFEDAVDFVKFIEDDALEVLIPRLIIQPVVENSIIHGKNNKKIVVRLSASIKDESVVIVVEDDGRGMDSIQTDELNRRFALPNDEYFSSYGTDRIGLENVNRRIKLIYGKQYGVFAESVQGLYTKITMTISKGK